MNASSAAPAVDEVLSMPDGVALDTVPATISDPVDAEPLVRRIELQAEIETGLPPMGMASLFVRKFNAWKKAAESGDVPAREECKEFILRRYEQERERAERDAARLRRPTTALSAAVAAGAGAVIYGPVASVDLPGPRTAVAQNPNSNTKDDDDPRELPHVHEGPTVVVPEATDTRTLAELPATTAAAEDLERLALLISELPYPRTGQVWQLFKDFLRALTNFRYAQRGSDVRARLMSAGEVQSMYGHAVAALRACAASGSALTGSSTGTPVATPSQTQRAGAANARIPPVVAAAVSDTGEMAPSPVTRVPSDAERDTLLKAAQKVFTLAHLAANTASVLFEYIRRHKLYEPAGFKQMREYARERLGLRSEGAFRDYARAGVTAWTHYSSQSRQIVDGLLQGGGVEFQPPPQLPSLPSVTVLRALPRALKNAEPGEHEAILKRAAAGEVTVESLRSLDSAKSARAAPAATSTRTGGLDDGAGSPASDVSPRDVAPPDIFLDVPDLEESVRGLRVVHEHLACLERAWADNPGPDTATVHPMLRAIVEGLAGNITALEDEVIPNTCCRSCRGKGCSVCDGTGWHPRVPRKPQTRPARTARLAEPEPKLHSTLRTKASRPPAKRETRPLEQKTALKPVKTTTAANKEKKNTTRAVKKAAGRCGK